MHLKQGGGGTPLPLQYAGLPRSNCLYLLPTASPPVCNRQHSLHYRLSNRQPLLLSQLWSPSPSSASLRVLLHRARTAPAPWQLLVVTHRCTIPRCTHPNSP